MSVAIEMSAPAASKRASERRDLDQALASLKEKAETFARTSPAEKAGLLRRTMDALMSEGASWARAGARAKGLPEDHGEDWLTGPVPTMRNARLLAEQLEAI